MSEAYEAFYYADAARNRQGPFSESEIAHLIEAGTIRRDTLIWSVTLVEWREAGSVDRFAAIFAHQPQPAPAPTSAPAPRAGMLAADFPVGGLFGRALLVVLGNLIVIPAPWVNEGYYRLLATHTVLPDGRRFTFAGQPGDIWLVFVGIAVLGLIGNFIGHFSLLTGLLALALHVLVIRWFCSKLGTDDGTTRLTFQGSVWGYIGWYLLLILSMLTIIGWAWVTQAWVRWMCQNTKGTLAFDFVGSGGAILWRTLVAVIGSAFLIPIPWIMQWYAVWFVSQIEVRPAAG